MAMTAGSAPSTWSSTLTGLSLEIYNNKIAQGIYKGTAQIQVTVDGDTYTEEVAVRNARVLNNKKDAYAEALAVVTHIQTTGVVTTVVVGSAGGDPIIGGAGTGTVA